MSGPVREDARTSAAESGVDPERTPASAPEPDPVAPPEQRAPWDHVQSFKEVIRHFAGRLGLVRILLWRRRRRGLVTEHLEPGDATARFQAAYESGAWVMTSDQQATSGAGSELAATTYIRTQLPALLTRLGCERLLDVGCGDWHWMRELDLPCEYVGIDVVPEVIQANRQFERPGVSFMLADATTDPLPVGDVALCREVLFHLSFEDGARLLANIGRSTRWLLATSDTAIWFNSDIRSGDFRRINLQQRPYSLPSPHEVIADDAVSPGRVLGLWSSADLLTRARR